MEQSAISDVDTDASDAKAKKRNGKHASQVDDANANAGDADEDQDPRAAPEDNAKGNALAKTQPTALHAKAKKAKKSKPASTSWFS